LLEKSRFLGNRAQQAAPKSTLENAIFEATCRAGQRGPAYAAKNRNLAP
jgi:hypothetical protein